MCITLNSFHFFLTGIYAEYLAPSLHKNNGIKVEFASRNDTKNDLSDFFFVLLLSRDQVFLI